MYALPFRIIDSVYQPTVLAVKSDKHLAERVNTYVPEGVVYSYSKMSFYGVNFYLKDRMRHIEKERPSSGGGLFVGSRKGGGEYVGRAGTDVSSGKDIPYRQTQL